MDYISICSGIEAATVAWEPVGFSSLAYSEIEPFPSAVLQHHYPNTPNLGDMTKYKEWPDYADVDVLVGGTPCQSFSVAGLRKGLADPRGNLMLTYLAIADRYLPTWICWENVPGVLSSNRGKDFGTFLGGLAELGYGFAYRILDSQFFGVPQRRRRVFVVGYLGDWRPAAAVLFESHSLSGHPAPSRKKGERVAPCLSQSLRSSGGIGMPNQELFSQGGAGLTWPEEPELYSIMPMNSGKDYKARKVDVAQLLMTSPVGGNQGGDFVVEPLVMAHGQGNAEIVSDGSPSLTCNHEAPIVIQDSRGLDKKQNGKGFSNDGTAYTLDSVSQQAVASFCPSHYTRGFGQHGLSDITGALKKEHNDNSPHVMREMQVRRLTPVECERLQGFPDDYTKIPWRGKDAKHCPDGPRYKALGNSMAVPVMRWIGARIQLIEELTNVTR